MSTPDHEHRRHTTGVARRVSRRALAATAIVLSAACDGPEPAETLQLVEPLLSFGVAGEPPWNYASTAAIDLNGDGGVEIITVTAAVELNDDGAPIWEDGHHWQAYIEDPAGERTYIYARFLPHGRLEAFLSWSQPDAPPTVVLLERTPISLGLYEVFYGGHDSVVATRLAERELRRNIGFTDRVLVPAEP